MDIKADVEELLRDGMEQFTKGVRAPAGLAAEVGRRHRRRVAVRVSAASGAVAAVAAAAALLAAGSPASTGAAGTQTTTVAYVVSHVRQALASEHLVYYGRTAGMDQPLATWAYGRRNRSLTFSGAGCQHVLTNGDCTHRGGSELSVADGIAVVKGKLRAAEVMYYKREYSLWPRIAPGPRNVCSVTARLAMTGPVVPSDHWSSFIDGTLACGTATVTGHVWVNGVRTTRITGKPVTVRLPRGMANATEKWARVGWTLYVDPATYLPVRISAFQVIGGPKGSRRGSDVTDVHWLKPTAANIAKATLTIPPGFHRVPTADAG
jgi:hypothetical protein